MVFVDADKIFKDVFIDFASCAFHAKMCHPRTIRLFGMRTFTRTSTKCNESLLVNVGEDVD